MKRREFITLTRRRGGGCRFWPCVAHAQEKVRRVGVLMNVTSDDPEAQQHVAAFQQGLQALGWIVGLNLQIDQRWTMGEVTRYRQAAWNWLRSGQTSSWSPAPACWRCGR